MGDDAIKTIFNPEQKNNKAKKFSDNSLSISIVVTDEEEKSNGKQKFNSSFLKQVANGPGNNNSSRKNLSVFRSSSTNSIVNPLAIVDSVPDENSGLENRHKQRNKRGGNSSPPPTAPTPGESPATKRRKRLGAIKDCLTSQKTRKICCGVLVTACVAASWVGATHAIKRTYILKIPVVVHDHESYTSSGTNSTASGSEAVVFPTSVVPGGHSTTTGASMTFTRTAKAIQMEPLYDAPFLTTWLSTLWTSLFFPLYFLFRFAFRSEKTSAGSIIRASVQGFRDRGFSAAQLLSRCAFFCLLWVFTNYLYVHSLRIIQCTAVMALFATNISFVYLLAWVVLHEQFVGVRIFAVILCSTGIALLAYKDGITRNSSLGGVVLAAAAAAGSAVYKVLFKKVLGEASFGQVAVVFSILGFLAALFLWPICLALPLLTKLELVRWDRLPWQELTMAGGLSLMANLLGNFGVAVTYEVFITLGLILAVPVSAVLDTWLYGVVFEGMFLAGIVLICIGFFLVLFPENWPDYITRCLRAVALLRHHSRWGRGHGHDHPSKEQEHIDFRTGHIRSHLRSPSGRVR